MKKLLCLMGGAMLLLHAHSQSTRSLKVGDTMPNLLLSNIVNNQTNSKYLYNVDKPIILDFFGTHCGVCISLLPHLNKIQEQKKDSLSIFIVAYEPAETIQHFLKSNPKVKGLSLPFITNDTVLDKLFRHHTIPHEVWIGKDHVIKAISSYNYVNQNNIQKFISGASLDLPVKDDYVKYDPSRSFGDYEQVNRLIFSSSLRGYIDNLRKFYHKTVNLSDSLNKKLVFSNCDLIKIIQSLFNHKYDERNRFMLNVKDSSGILPINTEISDHWFYNNSYCYELTVPRYLPDSAIWNYVLNDISRALNLKIQLRKLEMPCYVIAKTEDGKIDPITKGGKSKLELYPQAGHPVIIENRPISSLVGAMNAVSTTHPSPIVLDETGIKNNVDMTLDVSYVKDMPEVDRALHPYGLSLIKTKRIIDMVVISDL